MPGFRVVPVRCEVRGFRFRWFIKLQKVKRLNFDWSIRHHDDPKINIASIRFLPNDFKFFKFFLKFFHTFVFLLWSLWIELNWIHASSWFFSASLTNDDWRTVETSLRVILDTQYLNSRSLQGFCNFDEHFFCRVLSSSTSAKWEGTNKREENSNCSYLISISQTENAQLEIIIARKSSINPAK